MPLIVDVEKRIEKTVISQLAHTRACMNTDTDLIPVSSLSGKMIFTTHVLKSKQTTNRLNQIRQYPQFVG
jgi:hypothetical protein